MNKNLWKYFMLPQDEERGKRNVGKFQRDFRGQGSPELTPMLHIKPGFLNIIDIESMM